MAMIKCPECKKKMSTDADDCPKCGCKPTEEYKQKVLNAKPWYKKTWGRVAIVLLVLFAIVAVASDKGAAPDTQQKSSQATATPVKKPPAPGEAEFEEGTDFMIAGDYKTALTSLEKAAAKGHGDAKALMGYLYLHGASGVKQNTKKGFLLVQEAANQGSGYGLSWLGTYYIYGEYGLKKDAQTGLNLINKAMDSGHHKGYATMASLYETGAGIGKDFDKAIEMYQKAAQSGGGGSYAKDIKRIKDRPNYEVSVAQIIKEYEANQIAADKKYKGNKVRITGKIGTIGKDIVGNNYVTLKHPNQWELRSVQCYFSKGSESELSSLSSGQTVSIQGIGDGVIVNVSLEKCWVVSQ